MLRTYHPSTPTNPALAPPVRPPPAAGCGTGCRCPPLGGTPGGWRAQSWWGPPCVRRDTAPCGGKAGRAGQGRTGRAGRRVRGAYQAGALTGCEPMAWCFMVLLTRAICGDRLARGHRRYGHASTRSYPASAPARAVPVIVSSRCGAAAPSEQRFHCCYYYYLPAASSYATARTCTSTAPAPGPGRGRPPA